MEGYDNSEVDKKDLTKIGVSNWSLDLASNNTSASSRSPLLVESRPRLRPALQRSETVTQRGAMSRLCYTISYESTKLMYYDVSRSQHASAIFSFELPKIWTGVSFQRGYNKEPGPIKVPTKNVVIWPGKSAIVIGQS